ncbi:hypothetical protein [Piscinibacter sp.]|jgi:hypothetical protein|uniref:hypothetical protein n=1 Tax=Piscinibacter sp. TaxID=1903157 RepID=UPI002F3E9E87
MDTSHDLQAALTAFMQRRLADWHGLPPQARIDEARRILGLSAAAEGRGSVGSARHAAQWQSLDDRPLVLWARANELVLLEFEGPFDDLDALAALGAPAARLDVNWGVAPLPEGEWVYPERGLAVLVSPQGQALRLFGFAPMPLAAYQRDLRRNPKPRPMPAPRKAKP